MPRSRSVAASTETLSTRHWERTLHPVLARVSPQADLDTTRTNDVVILVSVGRCLVVATSELALDSAFQAVELACMAN